MRVTLLTVGSRGDVEPYVALGRGLRTAGHHVRLATHRTFEPLVGGAGLEFAPVEGDPRQLADSGEGRRWLASGRNPIKIGRRLARLAEPMLERYFEDCRAAVAGSDIAGYSLLGVGAYHAAEAAGIPSFGAWLQPLLPTGEFPSPFFPATRFPLGRVGNLATHLILQQATWQPARRTTRRWRGRLGLPPPAFFGPFREHDRSGHPVLLGYSRAVVPPARDWPRRVRVTGYWFSSDAPAPSRTLEAFLKDGPPPVYIGFGSRSHSGPDRLAELVVGALRSTGRRGILSTGWGGLAPGDTITDDILVVDEAPHAWLFPRTAAVVHHGGAGTTGAALRAGVPSLALPSFADQFFWAERIAALGVGPAPIRLSRVSVDRLARAITLAAEDTGMATRSAALGARIAEEDGVAEATAAVDALLNDGRI